MTGKLGNAQLRHSVITEEEEWESEVVDVQMVVIPGDLK